jgi:DNA-binding GntR family transcriptional regulator
MSATTSNPGDATMLHPDAVKPRKADDAYDVLKDLIISMQIGPGEPLDERTLMARLEIGRTPLREAIQRLTHDGLVVSRPRRGYYVSELSITDFQQMTAARYIIEPPIARLAACHITADEIRQLRTLIDDTLEHFEELGVIGVLNRDLEFHCQIALASRNRYLAQMVIELNTLMLRYWYISLSRAAHLKEEYVRHHDLIDLLERRDEVGVEAEMVEHIARFRRRMSEVIASGTVLSAL